VYLVPGLVLFLLGALLPSPWNVVVQLAVFALMFGELAYWTVRIRRKHGVSARTLIGQTATVVKACQPDGKVWLAGGTWDAFCEYYFAQPGDEVVVAGARDGLTVIVRPRPSARDALPAFPNVRPVGP
jgi:membrane protein implicated in regulation of membrane protease activity